MTTTVQKSDRSGLLLHFVERWSAGLEHPAKYTVDESVQGTVKVVFTFERQKDGKWTKVKRTASGPTIEAAAQDLREQLNKITRDGIDE